MSNQPETDLETDDTSTTARRPGRPRQISDDAIYMAGLMVLAQHGSEGITLGRVAAVLGVTAAAVRQRCGSKRGLLLEMARRRVMQTEARFAGARAAYESPLEALYQAFTAELDQIAEPTQVANAFSAYTDNLGDPEMRAAFAEELRTMERHVRELLEAAVTAGEIAGPATPDLASAVLAAVEGTMLIWAIVPRGELGVRIRETLAVVLRATGD